MRKVIIRKVIKIFSHISLAGIFIYFLIVPILSSALTATATFTLVISGAHPAGSSVTMAATGKLPQTCLASNDEEKTCQINLQAGAEITLTANPAANAAWGGWNNTCIADQANPKVCTFKLQNMRTVEAVFNEVPGASGQFMQIKGKISASNIGSTSASIQGQIINLLLLRQFYQGLFPNNPQLSDLTTFRVVYGENNTFNLKSGLLMVDKSGNFQTQLKDLKPDTIYQYQISGVFKIFKPSSPSTFKTRVGSGIAAESYATLITETEATIDGTILNIDPTTNYKIHLLYDIENKDSKFTIDGGPAQLIVPGNQFSITLKNLKPGTTYQYRLADALGVLRPSSVQKFTTSGFSGVNAFASINNLSDTSVRVEGYLLNENPQSLELSLDYSEHVSDNAAPLYDLTSGTFSTDQNGNYSVTLENLKTDTTYDYRLFDSHGQIQPTENKQFLTKPVPTAITVTGDAPAGPGISGLIKKINKVLINPLILLMFAAALAYFIYGVVMFLIGGDNEDARSKGKQHMLWGIIGMTIMMSVFGIMQLIINTLGIEGITPRGI